MQLITETGQIHPLNVGVNAIGRVTGNDIILVDSSMSRRHAELHWDGQECRLVDLGSTNGTYVDGRRLAPNQPQPLSPGARLSFGPTMTVTLSESTRPATGAPYSVGSPPSTPRIAGLDLIFQAIDVVLDPKKLGLALLGFLLASLVGAIFFWLFGRVFLDSPVIGIVLGLMGTILLWIVFVFLMSTITRLILTELLTGEQGTIRKALQYAIRHLAASLFSPLVLTIGLLLIMVAEGVILLLGRIDYLGEVVVSLLFLPLVLLNLAILVVAVFGTVLTFPVIADRGSGILDTVSTVLTILRRRPGRVIAYMMLASAVSLLIFLFVLYLLSSALYLTSSLVIVGMEPGKFSAVAGGSLIPGLPGLGGGLFSGTFWGQPPATFTVARFFLGLAVTVILVSTVAIPQMFFLASTCAVYLTIRQDLLDPVPGNPNLNEPLPEGPDTQEIGRKACRVCGASLAHDQSYCPYCKQLQR